MGWLWKVRLWGHGSVYVCICSKDVLFVYATMRYSTIYPVWLMCLSMSLVAVINFNVAMLQIFDNLHLSFDMVSSSVPRLRHRPRITLTISSLAATLFSADLTLPRIAPRLEISIISAADRPSRLWGKRGQTQDRRPDAASCPDSCRGNRKQGLYEASPAGQDLIK